MVLRSVRWPTWLSVVYIMERAECLGAEGSGLGIVCCHSSLGGLQAVVQ
jgi:hypothetical protein